MRTPAQRKSSSSAFNSPRRRLTSSSTSSAERSLIPAAIALLLRAYSRFPNSVCGVNLLLQRDSRTTVAWEVLLPGSTGPAILIAGTTALTVDFPIFEGCLEVNGRTLPTVKRFNISSTKVTVSNTCQPSYSGSKDSIVSGLNIVKNILLHAKWTSSRVWKRTSHDSPCSIDRILSTSTRTPSSGSPCPCNRTWAGEIT